MSVIKLFEEEIKSYQEDEVEISRGGKFSQKKLVDRLYLYANGIYPSGKLDSQNKYKYWFDIISPRIDSEVKNIDFDTRNILLFSDSDKDAVKIFAANAYLKEFLRESGSSEKLNDSVEIFSGWGNAVWKKVKDDYDVWHDWKNFYVINQTAKTLNDTPVIERHELSQKELREKKGIWKNIDLVIEGGGEKSSQSNKGGEETVKQLNYYEIFERNGELSEKMLFEAQGEKGGSEDKYVLAKIIIAGLGKSSQVLYAKEISEMPYKEAHRGRYTGRWWRVGLYETLLDCQTRSNEIGNQIARGLEWASKTIFKSPDRLIAQNILTDMNNGDIIKGELAQIETRMNGLDQLIADWNRIMQIADKLSNSYEVVQGETMPSGTPFRLGVLLNQNANKFFDFVREKLASGIKEVFENWILPQLLKELKLKDVIRITGNEEFLNKYYEMVVNGWYLKNLVRLPPHGADVAQRIKAQKILELKERPNNFLKNEREMWEEFLPRVQVIITGENVDLAQEMETLATFINLEGDPVRRTALIEIAMKKKNIDVSSLPKSEIPPSPSMVAGAQGGMTAKR